MCGPSPPRISLWTRRPGSGTVRELRSTIRRAALLSRDGIRPEHLLALGAEPAAAARVGDPDPASEGRSLKLIAAAAAAAAERLAISQALQATKGNQSA